MCEGDVAWCVYKVCAEGGVCWVWLCVVCEEDVVWCVEKVVFGGVVCRGVVSRGLV